MLEQLQWCRFCGRLFGTRCGRSTVGADQALRSFIADRPRWGWGSLSQGPGILEG